MEERAAFMAVSGGRLWTARRGSGRPLVLCHGGPGAYDYLGSLAAMLEDRFTVLRYDQRGSGRSEVTGPVTMAAMIDDIEALRRALGIEAWIAGGHSFGANLALAYAAAHPARVRAILYVSGTGLDPAWHAEYVERRLERLARAEQEEFARLRADLPTFPGPATDGARRRLRELSRVADVVDPCCLNRIPDFSDHPVSDAVNVSLGAEWEALSVTPAFRAAVATIPAPALLLHGAGDPRPARFVEDLARRLLRAEFHLLPDCGHWPWIERPDPCAARLRSFLRGVPP
jgi:proline iminopeptidase